MRAKQEIEHLLRKIETGKLPEDEPLFVLRAKDVLASGLIHIWIIAAKAMGVPSEKLDKAQKLADEIDSWPIKEIPGCPETPTGDKNQ